MGINAPLPGSFPSLARQVCPTLFASRTPRQPRRCRSPHAIKQLSLRHLPPVLVLHAKRFEHPGGLRGAARKLETDLAFPLHDLDMRPYLSSSLLRSRWACWVGENTGLQLVMSLNVMGTWVDSTLLGTPAPLAA